MVLKLYGIAASPNITRVGVILHEKKVPFEFIPVKTQEGEHKKPAYLAKQPFGQVPYMDDDGFILYESWAIVRYVCEKYRDQGPNLIPTDLKKCALFEQAASIEQANFGPYARIIVWEGFVKQLFFGQEPDEVKHKEAIATLESKLDAYEQILSNQKYLAGDEITLADLIHLGYGSILSRGGCNALLDAEKRPSLARWFKELESRPSWQAVKDGVKSSA